MKKEFFDEMCIEVTENIPYTMKLTYYLLTDSVREEFCDLNVYGVEIDKESRFKNGKIEREKKIIGDLFFRKGEAEEFLRRISDNQVTPMGLKDVISDYIGERLHLC
ncbi:MAG: hypothetical protein J6C82_02695 [Clostridia bacterium]|nr:hypothetical protein [Clostridia bacterium]